MTTKKELIDSIANRTGVKKSGAELVLNATLAEIERALLAGQPVILNGFGTFELKKRDARAGQHAFAQAVPIGWREQFATEVYADLEAADNQDVPLEEYPARILKVLDSTVGPRHPVVIKWRNDAIEQCIAIALKYCRDPESHKYLKQDLEAMLASAPAHPAEGVPAQAVQPSDALIEAVDAWFADNTGLGGCSDKDVAELAAIFATQPAAQGLDAETQRHAAIGIGKAIERACTDLPDGTEISVSLEKDAGTVTLIDQDGNEHENFSCDYGFASMVNEAIDAAIAAQTKKKGEKR